MTRRAEARLFVAVDLPASVRAELTRWARAAASSVRAASRAALDPGTAPPRARAGRPPARRAAGGRLRLLEPDALHVTLCFLGSRPVGEIEAFGEALAAACAEATPVGELAFGAPLWLPTRRPRALAVELHDDGTHALGALHDFVAESLAAVSDLDLAPRASGAGRGASRRGGRFRPHVTVARLRAADAPRLRGLPATPPLSFCPQSVTLFRSWLTPTEAVYEGLITHSLMAP
jgi:RNA 2',3'-cyclic 3'-phosphodiesterase